MCRRSYNTVEPYPLITPHPHPDWGMCVYIKLWFIHGQSTVLAAAAAIYCTVRGRYCAKDVAMLLRAVHIWVVLLAACAKFAWSQGAGERQTVDSACVRMCMELAAASRMQPGYKISFSLLATVVLVNHALQKSLAAF